MWKIIDTGTNSAEENMRLDSEFLASLKPTDSPILHFYDWERDSATYGYFIKCDQFIDREKALKKKLDTARRPTGGGIVFHLFDLAFSVLVPSGHPAFSTITLENYAFVNRAVKKAVLTLLPEMSPELLPQDPEPLTESCRHFCMAKPTIYDVMMGSRKIAGAAQRKKKQGFLHQGTIAIAPPDEAYLADILLPGDELLEAMLAHTHTLLPENYSKSDLDELRVELKHHLKQALTEEEEKAL